MHVACVTGVACALVRACMQVWDMNDLGLQAAQRIAQSSDPLAMLADISQNFPGLVSSLSRQTVNASLRSAVQYNQVGSAVQSGWQCSTTR